MESSKATGERGDVILVVDDDPQVRSAMSLLLETCGRNVVTCDDPDAAIAVAPHYKPSVALIDMKYSGPFSFEGLSLIGGLQALVPNIRVLVMTGDASGPLRDEAIARGATALLAKPFGAEDVDRFVPESGATESPFSTHVPSLDEMLRDLLHMHFQRIVTLDGQEIIGWEALARVDTDTPMRSPETLFKYARLRGRSFDLNRACALAAIRSGASLARESRLFINLDPEILPRGREIVEAVTEAAAIHGVEMNRIVFEVTEKNAIVSDDALKALSDLRQTGAAIAFDDLGIAYAHFPQLASIQPSFMKIAQEFGSSLHTDPTRREIVRHFRGLAKTFSCRLILEGIETELDAQAARDLDIELGQGYHFGRPGPLER